MEIKILCVGDVVGAPGRNALREGLERLVPDLGVDMVIVNAENVAAGSGLTPALFEKIIHYGAHVVTLGDHIYRRKEIIPVLERSDRVVRPCNLPPSAPGKEYAVWTMPNGARVAVISVLGRLFMRMPVNCPFANVDRVLLSLPRDVKCVVVDVHAEATSEKVAMGWHLDGRVSAVLGTHTHVPTADERVLPKGTAYITDIGMTGPFDSVLGRNRERVLSAMMTSVPAPFDVAEHDARLSGVLITIDATTGRAATITRVMHVFQEKGA
jgi:hypothetical protein